MIGIIWKGTLYRTVSSDRELSDQLANSCILGPVVQSIVSLMMLLVEATKSIMAVFFFAE